VLQHYGVAVADRIASIPSLACLAVVTMTNSFIFTAAVYMRAHRTEPMLAPSVVGGLLTLVATYYASAVSTTLTMALYAGLTLCVGLPYTIHLLRPYLGSTRPQS
jgi:predicted RND superfamily exporter protein